jgi:hypothetical protein
MAGRWINSEPANPGFPANRPPWHVSLYVDERAHTAQHDALAGIFLGRLGGGTHKNYGRNINEVYAIRSARITLDHTPGKQRMRAGSFIEALTRMPVKTELRVSCGIPGHDHPGQEVIAELMRVNDGELQWELRGRCGFASDFAFSS